MTADSTTEAQLVERGELQGKIWELLEGGKATQLGSKRIINLYGITGIGKTTSLRQLYHKYREHKHPYNVFFYNFDPQENSNKFVQIDRGEALSQLRRLPQLASLSEHILPERLSRPPDKPVVKNETVGTLVLLDALDDMDDWFAIQEELIIPLMEDTEHPTAIVCTSQTPLYWHFWDLTEQCEYFGLRPFKEKQVEELLERHELSVERKPLIKLILDFTQGYPLAVTNIIETYQKDIRLRNDDNDPAIYATKVEKLSEEAREAIMQVGMLRRFEIGMVSYLLIKSDKETLRELAKKPIKLNEQIVRELRGVELIKRYKIEHDRSEFFPPGLRNLVKQRTDPIVYSKICEHIAERLYERAEKGPINDSGAFLDWLYFAAELTSLYTRVDQRNVIKQQIEDLFENAAIIVQRVYERSPLTSIDLVIRFYRDEELIRELRNEKNGALFARVEELMRKKIIKAMKDAQNVKAEELKERALSSVGDHSLPPFEYRTLPEFDHCRIETLRHAVEKLTLGEAIAKAPQLLPQLRKAVLEPDSFSLAGLKRRLKNEGFEIEAAETILAKLENSGLLTPISSESNQSIQLHPYFKRMYSNEQTISEVLAEIDEG
jgi:hypothetical protein